MFSNHVYKIIILPTLVIRIPKLEIFLICQHKSTGGGNLELRQTRDIQLTYGQVFLIIIIIILFRKIHRCLTSSIKIPTNFY
jgi:hypothetical protein